MGRLDMARSLKLVLVYVGLVNSINPKLRKTTSVDNELTGPSCSPSDAMKNEADWTRCPFAYDNNAWYGLTNEAMNYYEAAEKCNSFGAKLVSASDVTLDTCSAYAIDMGGAFDQMVLYSGRYLYGVSTWVWCSGDKCDSGFDYLNWDNSSSSEGNCMGGYLQDYNSAGGSDGVTGYGWVQRECSEVSVRAMCRLDCDDVGPVTTEQYLMYTMVASQAIHSYTFDVDQVPLKNGQFTIPYPTEFPGLSFNSQLGMLEVIGNYWSSSNTNHKMMTVAGSFSDAPDSLFNGDYLFEVVHSQNVGTLVLSGYGHSGSTLVYIITQNSNWNKVESSDKYLSDFQNPAPSSYYYEYGVLEQDDKIYLVGGYADENINTVQVVNFRDVDDLLTAQTRQWTFLENLKNAVYKPAVVHRENELLIVGYTEDSTTCQDVQYLNLATNTTGVYADTIECGKYEGYEYPGIYSIGSSVSIFGGYKAEESCMQQISSGLSDTEKWQCFTTSESALQGLTYYSDGEYIRYSNFVL